MTKLGYKLYIFNSVRSYYKLVPSIYDIHDIVLDILSRVTYEASIPDQNINKQRHKKNIDFASRATYALSINGRVLYCGLAFNYIYVTFLITVTLIFAPFGPHCFKIIFNTLYPLAVMNWKWIDEQQKRVAQPSRTHNVQKRVARPSQTPKKRTGNIYIS